MNVYGIKCNIPNSLHSVLAVIAVDHHCSHTADGGVRQHFQIEPETTMEDYKMIRELSKWVGGTLSSEVFYSLYLGKDGRQLKASGVVGNSKCLFKWIVPQSILLITFRRMQNEDKALLDRDSYAGLRETRKRNITNDKTKTAYWRSLIHQLSATEQIDLKNDWLAHTKRTPSNQSRGRPVVSTSSDIHVQCLPKPVKANHKGAYI